MVKNLFYYYRAKVSENMTEMLSLNMGIKSLNF